MFADSPPGVVNLPWTLPPAVLSAALSSGYSNSQPPQPLPALDSNALKLIHRYFCHECQMEEARRKQGAAAAPPDSPGDGSVTSWPDASEQPISPQTALDEASLQQTMDLNKECK